MTPPDAQSFDAFAAAFDRFTSVFDEPAWPWLSSPEVGVVGGGRALDAGCGSGRRCAELAAHFDEVVGIDLSGPLIELARAKRTAPDVRFEVADLATFDDGQGFDLVYSAATLHHVVPLEPALAHLRSLVRPGGHVVLLDLVQRVGGWKRWLWRHGAVRLTPLRDVPGHVRTAGAREAWHALRFQTSGPWVRHLLSDAYLRPDEFAERYRSVFPDGRILDAGLTALVWQAPEAPQPRGAASLSTSQTTRSATTRAAGTSAPS